MPDLVAIPLYEPIILGNPFYIILMMFMGAGLVLGAIAVYTEIYTPLKSVWGVRGAMRGGTPLSIIFGMNGKIWLEELQHIAGIFSSMALPLKWIITAPVSGQLDKANTIVVSDDWNIVHNLDIDYAIVAMANAWNEKATREGIRVQYWDTEKKALVDGEDLDLIYDWDTFNSHLMDGSMDKLYPDGVKLPPFRIVNMHEIRKYLPVWDASHHAGYINQEVAEREEKDDKEGKEWIKFAIVAGAIILLSAVMAYVILTNK